MLKSSFCEYNDAYVLVKGNIAITGSGADVAAKQAGKRDKEVIFKNCSPFTNCITEINYTQIDNVKNIVAMPMHNLIEYSDNYSKRYGSLWQYRDELYDPDDETLTDSESFKFKAKITRNTPNDGNKKDVEIAVPLKYFNNFWRILDMPLINCEINLILT